MRKFFAGYLRRSGIRVRGNYADNNLDEDIYV